MHPPRPHHTSARVGRGGGTPALLGASLQGSRSRMASSSSSDRDSSRGGRACKGERRAAARQLAWPGGRGASCRRRIRHCYPALSLTRDREAAGEQERCGWHSSCQLAGTIGMAGHCLLFSSMSSGDRGAHKQRRAALLVAHWRLTVHAECEPKNKPLQDDCASAPPAPQHCWPASARLPLLARPRLRRPRRPTSTGLETAPAWHRPTGTRRNRRTA